MSTNAQILRVFAKRTIGFLSISCILCSYILLQYSQEILVYPRFAHSNKNRAGLNQDTEFLISSPCADFVKAPKDDEAAVVHYRQGWKTLHMYVGPEITCSIDSFESFSQVNQDTVIHTMFPSRGYFIDLAANDWQHLSNTYSLERYSGWDGLCIEPNSLYWEGYLKRRCTMAAAVISNSKDELIHFSLGNGAFGGIVAPGADNSKVDVRNAGVKQFYTVNTYETFKKFSVPATIQYISLDVEGAEESIIESFPFDTYTVLAFTIERPSKKVLEILELQNFVEVGILGNFGDTMYLNKRTPKFIEVLKKGQIQITKIEKKIVEVTEEDIFPVRNVRKSRAQGVRCPYHKLDHCHKTLLHYTATYETVLKRLGLKKVT